MKTNTLNKLEGESLTKTILSTVGKTIGVILFCLGFIVCTASVVTPNLIIPVFNSLGCDNASYLVYKRIYERDPSKNNLYNVIALSIESERFVDQAFYIDKMLEDEDFSNFAKIVDEKTKEVLGERFSIYADSYESYLRRHLVVALYKSGRALEAKFIAIDSVYGSVDEMHQYVRLVVDDEELIDIQKESELTTLYTRYAVKESLELKNEELDELKSLATTKYDKVIIIEEKLKIAEIQFFLGKYAKDAELEVQAETNIKNWTEEIKTLLSSI